MPFSIDYYATVDSLPLDIPYGLVFIDIVVFDKNGFELSKRIREKYGEETTAIVFVTSFVNYAIEGYSVGASAYIVKPYTFDAFCLRLRTIIKPGGPGSRSPTLRSGRCPPLASASPLRSLSETGSLRAKTPKPNSFGLSPLSKQANSSCLPSGVFIYSHRSDYAYFHWRDTRRHI